MDKKASLFVATREELAQCFIEWDEETPIFPKDLENTKEEYATLCVNSLFDCLKTVQKKKGG